ncbi:flagellar hook-associated protein FlgL [Acetobacter estunensis NRIC 0472]|uniref:Flagellin n=1 Tax=Acetobacter estunensis TaxID=104097 RepID=A0A967EHS0_9PROT|nr:flagellin [Acetobacter estunensis]NHO54082.1 flagellin [Acetobacter estunensis]GBQ24216.1 flagellar hook-associated protein FlgL [Acetobacter estunensis NRIC 0472]
MSTSVGLYGASGASYVLDQAIDRLGDQETDLTAQATSGMKSSSYAGLDSSSRTAALDLSPQITAISTWQTSISSAQTTLTVTQSALTQISSIATTLSTNLLSLQGNLGQDEVDTIATSAKSALDTLGNLLNTQSGADYVFAGTNSYTAPVTGTSGLSSSDLAQSISTLVSNMGTSSDDAATVLQQATSDASGTGDSASLSVFSSALSVSADSAKNLTSKAVVGNGDTVDVGMVATQSTEGMSASDTSTGSPIRDLMRNLMIVASLGDVSTSSSSFSSLVSSLKSSTSDIGTSLLAEEGSLGLQQTQLTSQSTLLTTMSTMLSTQLGNAREADPATVSVQLSAVQDQLQASYTLISDLKSMTLANYI